MFCFDGFGIKHERYDLETEGFIQTETDEDRIKTPRTPRTSQTASQKQIFQSYLAKFMCNASEASEEGSAKRSRFVFYNVDENE